MWETQAWSLGWEDPLEKEMASPLQYSCLENPIDRGAGRLQSMGLRRVGHDWVTSFSLSNSSGGSGSNGASFRRPCACPATLSAPDPAAGHHRPMLSPETPAHSRASLGQSLVGSLFPSLGSWCTQHFVCALQEFVPPVLCKFWRVCGGVNLLQEG